MNFNARGYTNILFPVYAHTPFMEYSEGPMKTVSPTKV